MNDKLRWFYRIAIILFAILILSNTSVKAIIWFSALKQPGKAGYNFSIRIGKYIGKSRFTSKSRQRLFNSVDYLFAPAFGILFTVAAVKLIKTPGIFEEG